jgi:hypothetical protein
MSISSTTRRASALILSAVAIGAAMGYAVSAFGDSPRATADHPTASEPAQRATRAPATGDRRSRLRRAVSISAVVPAGGGRFATLSIARGVLVDTSGDSLTLREGTRKVAYKTVTLPVSADARVRLSKQPSSLGALSAGDHVVVITGPHRTTVVARPAKSGRTPAASQSTQGSESTVSES